jgi:hypothetical protein
MAIATKTKTSIQNSPGQVYLLASPTTVTATLTAGITKELFAKIFADGDIRGALVTSLSPWACIDKGGYKEKIQATEIKIEPNDGPEEVVGFQDLKYSAEFTLYDNDVDHMKDILSASAAEVLALAASATQAGRSTLLGGGQRYPTNYLLAYVYPSKRCPGENNTILVPACNLVIDTDRENGKSKTRELKIKVIGKPFDLLLDPTTGMPCVWLEDFVINPKTP